tara:strand:- start:1197 stop:2750 length:1554 start_codon:yes stop_codon:yes gene_type:complete
MAGAAISKPTRVDIEFINLIDFTLKNVIDIKQMVMEFSIYEDLYAPTMKMGLGIMDAQGLVERFPIVGQEYIYISYKTGGEDFEYTRHWFRVQGIQERSWYKERDEVYILECVSQEFIRDLHTSVKGAYQGLSAGKIIQRVYSNYLQNPDDRLQKLPGYRDKPLHICFDTKVFTPERPLHIIANGRSPIDLINQVCKESVTSIVDEETGSTMPVCDYLFFERSDGFHFTSLAQLRKGYGGYGESWYKSMQNIHCDDMYTGDMNVQDMGTGKKQSEATVIEGISIINNKDMVYDINEGYYDNTVSTLDPLRKTYTKRKWHYGTDFDKGNLVTIGLGEKFKDIHPEADEMDKAKFDGSSKGRYIISTETPKLEGSYKNAVYLKGRVSEERDDGTEKINDRQMYWDRNRHTQLHKAVASWASEDKIVLNITVPGHTNTMVGQTVEVHIPQTNDQDNGARLAELNRLWSNSLDGSTFLVTAVKHKYSSENDELHTTVSVTKNAFARSPFDFNVCDYNVGDL